MEYLDAAHRATDTPAQSPQRPRRQSRAQSSRYYSHVGARYAQSVVAGKDEKQYSCGWSSCARFFTHADNQETSQDIGDQGDDEHDEAGFEQGRDKESGGRLSK